MLADSLAVGCSKFIISQSILRERCATKSFEYRSWAVKWMAITLSVLMMRKPGRKSRFLARRMVLITPIFPGGFSWDGLHFCHFLPFHCWCGRRAACSMGKTLSNLVSPSPDLHMPMVGQSCHCIAWDLYEMRKTPAVYADEITAPKHALSKAGKPFPTMVPGPICLCFEQRCV